MSDVFIGVVSHARSRFADAQGPEGLALRLAKALHDIGLGTSVQVNTANLLDESVLPITPELMRESPAEELRIERDWAHFLGQDRRPDWWLRHAMRWAKLSLSRARQPNPSAVRRLLNIELSHVDLMRRALDAGSSWALILEDDAGADDVIDLAAGLRGLLESADPPAFINLSTSFTIDQLRVAHLMEPAIGVEWLGATPRTVLRARRPVTNTVCAIAYRREFLGDLVPAMDALPMTPVAPIDWKLNRALMALARQSPECWWVEPGPVLQRSMHT